ncbi:hypothetical protein JI664_12825 [Rhodobacter sp. NTK016B]|uniref:hypothetical protein n=1 Tax=Rhodobacter sp. NTK016B TaxID=2759676 RepID=UPI001A8CBAD3|nr:hypothetical protein [Rhodobacter sp. NTK016B]MBN8292851.1 hypothetical protein [Rhodobacter sp. NTK016B]
MPDDFLKVVTERGGAWLADASGKVLPGQKRCVVDSERGGSTVTATFHVPHEKAPPKSEALWVDALGNLRRGAKPS